MQHIANHIDDDDAYYNADLCKCGVSATDGQHSQATMHIERSMTYARAAVVVVRFVEPCENSLHRLNLYFILHFYNIIELLDNNDRLRRVDDDEDYTTTITTTSIIPRRQSLRKR